jgi:hypothetical protein
MNEEPKEFGANTKGNGEGISAVLRSALAYLEGEENTRFRMKLLIKEEKKIVDR